MKNILLIGLVGSGKSALANLLINKEESFEKEVEYKEEFKESDGSVGETRDVQVSSFRIGSEDYQIIDTIGIGGIKLTEEEIVREIFKACYKFDEGLTQVLFIIGGRITLEEMKVYNVIKKKLFDNDITKYTTIVRTKFHNFRDPEKCKADTEKLKKESTKISKMIDSCNKVIYVDNHPLSAWDEEELIVYKKLKKTSRDILVKHLVTCQEDVYKPNNLRLINEIFVENYVKGDENNFMQFLKESIGRLKSEGFFSKKTKEFKQLLKREIETVKEMTRSSLQAAIEIGNNCRQM